MKRITTRITDMESGEVVYEKDEDMRHERYTQDDKYQHIANNRKFFILVRPGFPKELRPADIGNLVKLCFCLSDDGVMLNERKLPLKVPEMMDRLGMAQRAYYGFMNRLKAAGVVRSSDGAYYVNPVYLSPTRFVSLESYRVFADLLDERLPEWVKAKFRIALLGQVP